MASYTFDSPTENHEEDDDYDDEYDLSPDPVPGWRLAARGVELALNNRVDAAHRLLEGTDGIQARAGVCFLAFMVRMVVVVLCYEDLFT